MTDHIRTDNSQVIVNAHKLQDAIDQALADYAKGVPVHDFMLKLKQARTEILGEAAE